MTFKHLVGRAIHTDTLSVIPVSYTHLYPAINNADEYIGFLYGMYSSNLDLECVFIDGLMKHTGINLEDVPGFITRLKQLSAECGIDFYVSLSAEKDSLTGDAYEGCTFLN